MWKRVNGALVVQSMADWVCYIFARVCIYRTVQQIYICWLHIWSALFKWIKYWSLLVDVKVVRIRLFLLWCSHTCRSLFCGAVTCDLFQLRYDFMIMFCDEKKEEKKKHSHTHENVHTSICSYFLLYVLIFFHTVISPVDRSPYPR